jgi:membrane-associated protease RseP (regulator of RpoE activity)
MTHRHRALTALILAAFCSGGFAAIAAAQSSSERRAPSASTTVRGGFLGVNLQDFSGDLRQTYDYDGNGAVVSSVQPGSPAARIGVQEGDIITRFNGQSVSNANQLTRRVRALSPNSRASISVWRDGKEIELGRVTLGDRSEQTSGDAWTTPRARRSVRTPEAPEAPRAPRTMRAPDAPDVPDMDDEDNNNGQDEGDDDGAPMARMGRGMGRMGQGMGAMAMLGRGRLGVETRDLEGDLGEYFQTPDGKGVLVLSVVDGTPAERAGLKAGDVILAVDGDDVDNTEDLRKELRGKKAGPVELRVQRKGTERTIRAELEEPRAQGMMGSDMEGLSPEDRAKLRKDLEKLHKEMREMSRDSRNKH